MQSTSHTTIATIKNYVEAWRKANQFSRETAVQIIVETHEKLGFDVVSGIHFSPNTKDAYERMKVNADRVYRWLDDVTTDRNLLPANFMVSVIAALPIEMREACVSEIFFKIDIVAEACKHSDECDLNVSEHLPELMKETHEALHSSAILATGLTDENLLTAKKELGDAEQKIGRFRRLVLGAIAARNRIGKALRVVGGKR